MLYILLIVILLVLTVVFIVPTVIFYILFRTKYKGIIENGNFQEIINLWMNKITGGASNTEKNVNARSASLMSIDEALELLNLKPKPSPTKKEIDHAYYMMMKKYHPDKGGSDYVAKKLNEARSILLNNKK